MSNYTWVNLQLYELLIIFFLGYTYNYMSNFTDLSEQVNDNIQLFCL